MKRYRLPAYLLAFFLPALAMASQLAITFNGEKVEIRGPTTNANVRLMESIQLVPPLSWRTHDEAPVVSGGILTAVTTPNPARRFFLLEGFDLGGDRRLPPPYLSETLPPPGPLPAATLVPLQQFVFETFPTYVAVPAFPHAVAFLMHDRNESAASFVSRPHTIELINRFLLDRMAVVITESAEQGSPAPVGAEWDVTNGNLPANLDAARLLRLWREVVADHTDLENGMPLYTCGFGHGGHFALQFARISALARRPVNAVCVASMPAADVAAVNALLAAPGSAYRVFVASNGGDLNTDLAFNETAGDVQYIGANLRVEADSFEAIGGISDSESATIVNLLQAAGVIDERGVRRVSLSAVDAMVAGVSWPPGIDIHAAEIEMILKTHFARNPDFRTFLDDMGSQNLVWICRGTSDVTFPPPAALGDVTPGLTSHTGVVPGIPPTVVTSRPEGLPGSAGNEMYYAVPADPVGLVFYFHGGGGNSAQVTNPNQLEAMNAITDARFAYVAYGSADRENKLWNTCTLDSSGAPDFSNPDWLQLVSARDYLVSNTAITSNTPIYLMGFSSGGVASIALGYLAQQAALNIRAVSVHGSGGCEPGSLRIAPVWNLPTFYSVLANDPKAIAFSDLREVFTANGVPMEYHVGTERTLTPERFLRIPTVSSESALNTFDFAVSQGYVDSNGLRLNPMPSQTAQFNNEPGINTAESAQFKTAMAGHVFTEEFKDERVEFFRSHLP